MFLLTNAKKLKENALKMEALAIKMSDLVKEPEIIDIKKKIEAIKLVLVEDRYEQVKTVRGLGV